MKSIEARLKEERLNIQQQHSDEIQKILDRKNSEIESLKSNFNKKKKEYEENIEDLIKKVHMLKNEASMDREIYEKQTSEMRIKIENSVEKKQIESEKKVN